MRRRDRKTSDEQKLSKAAPNLVQYWLLIVVMMYHHHVDRERGDGRVQNAFPAGIAMQFY